MPQQLQYELFPLGDSAITIDFGNLIDEQINKKVIAIFKKLSDQPFEGMIEAVPAYSSVSVYYDLSSLKQKFTERRTVYETVKEKMEAVLTGELEEYLEDIRSISIPVCYEAEFATDLLAMAELKKISPDQLVEIHYSKSYRVFMLGFLPGFSYMGEVDDRIAMPRKLEPVPVAAGSVAIAGKQTGIYPLNSPGGWHVIGRTPVKLFDPAKQAPCALQAGDMVQFYPISKHEFENYQAGNT